MIPINSNAFDFLNNIILMKPPCLTAVYTIVSTTTIHIVYIYTSLVIARFYTGYNILVYVLELSLYQRLLHSSRGLIFFKH
jgi:hypothetical protein